MRAVLLALLLASGCRLEPPAAGGAGGPGADGQAGAIAQAPAAPDGPARLRGGVVPEATDPTAAPSGLVVPVAGVAPADLVDTYDDARSEGRVHDAIDIPAPRGTPVVAAVSGPVLQVFMSDKGGLTVYQLGPDARMVYYYAHLDATADGLAPGQVLRAGDALGTVGDSGNAGPGNTHLHFAIWRVTDPADFWDGPSVNPYPLLTGRR